VQKRLKFESAWILALVAKSMSLVQVSNIVFRFQGLQSPVVQWLQLIILFIAGHHQNSFTVIHHAPGFLFES